MKTLDRERKARVCELHHVQPMVLQATPLLTFCADRSLAGLAESLRRKPLLAAAAGTSRIEPRLLWSAAALGTRRAQRWSRS